MPVSIQVEKLLVRSLDKALNEVSWQVKNTTEDLLDYTFQVFRSESPSGPFDKISEPFTDRFLFIDNAILVGDRWRQLHYELEVTHVPSGDKATVGPATLAPDADLIAVELRRHIQLLMNEWAGRMCWILPVRTFGQRCSCWDPRLGKRTRAGCLTCYDTGWVRGYMSPIEVWMQVDPSPRTKQTTNVGPQQQSNTTARLGYFPIVKPGDLIVEPENRRWRVITATGTEHLRAVVHQEITLHEIPPRDMEYSIVLQLDTVLRDLYFTPPRNFVMPSNLENFMDTEMESILSMYRNGGR